MPKIDLESIEQSNRTGYPAPFDKPVQGRRQRKIAEAAGLTALGARHVVLEPGAWSSQRHWHEREDEFVYVLSGEVTLVTDDGYEVLRAGDAAGFKANDANGHCLQNRSDRDAVVLEIGSRIEGETAHYNDIDMMAHGGAYTHRDGTPYPKTERRGP
jgi:uncharacterized cupin superfamily protein